MKFQLSGKFMRNYCIASPTKIPKKARSLPHSHSLRQLAPLAQRLALLPSAPPPPTPPQVQSPARPSLLPIVNTFSSLTVPLSLIIVPPPENVVVELQSPLSPSLRLASLGKSGRNANSSSFFGSATREGRGGAWSLLRGVLTIPFRKMRIL